MGDFYTGANVTKNAQFYSVEYKGQLVAQFAFRDQALMLALDSVQLETLLQESNVFFLKAA
jgi:hypothetical protein